MRLICFLQKTFHPDIAQIDKFFNIMEFFFSSFAAKFPALLN